MITQITTVVVKGHVKGGELGKLLLDRLLVTENGLLVEHDCAHIGLEGVHVLADVDLVILGLILVRIE